MTKRQIMVELEIEDEDRLIAIASSIPDYIRLNWAQEVTAEAFLDGKKALSFYPTEISVLHSMITDSQAYLEQNLEYAGDNPDDEDGIEQSIRDVQEFEDTLKLQLGEALSFDEHWNVIRTENGDVLQIDIEPGPHLTDEQASRTWTVMDCEGRLGITPGLAYVNRLHYIQTTEPWTDDDFKKEWIY
jgi:hypothetical protein